MENRATLKSYFETGDKPTQLQFASFIDSSVNITDDLSGIQEKIITIDFESDGSDQTILIFDETFDEVIITGVYIYMESVTGSAEAPVKYVRFRSDSTPLLSLAIGNSPAFSALATFALEVTDASAFDIFCEIEPTGVTAYNGKAYIKYFEI